MTLTIAQERVQQLAKTRALSSLFELFYNVCGQIPPVNNIGYHERDHPPFPDGWGGLKHAHAIFRGIRRPMNGEGIDRNVFVYVVKPLYVYRSVVDMVCVAKRLTAPKGAVFVAYVVFENEGHTTGKVLNWEWVEADEVVADYPRDFNSRYDERVWANG